MNDKELANDINDNSYLINITGLRIYAYHGVNKEEKTLGQFFEIDLELLVKDINAAKTDDINEVLAYDTVVKSVESVFTSNRYNLIEKAAHSVILELNKFPQIKKVKIKVKKPSPPIPTSLNSVSVTLEQQFY